MAEILNLFNFIALQDLYKQSDAHKHLRSMLYELLSYDGSLLSQKVCK